jgi:two-component system, NtrC family, response regulator AtoC
VKSPLLVLSVLRNEEARISVKTSLQLAGHRVIEAFGCAQAQILLSNGLMPDLLLADAQSEDSRESSVFHQLLRDAANLPTLLLAERSAAEPQRSFAGFSPNTLFSTSISVVEIESLVQSLTHSDTAPVCMHGAASVLKETSAALSPFADAAPFPLIEEFGEGGFFLAASPKMLEIQRQAKLIAGADVPVLILGESGTGKEVVARLIHTYSSRAHNKFLKVNCAALPAELLESELFGYQKGAFTGAFRDRPGRFEQADNGTLLLDEIGEMSGHMQAKILHVLQDGQFSRLGGQESIRPNVRVLAATNVQMENALREKSFREDLYYRLGVFTISIPPLRERREEIPFLVGEIIRRAPRDIRKCGDLEFSPELMDSAMNYEWPGNLRELHNFVTRTIILRDQSAACRELEMRMHSLESGPNSGSAAVEFASHFRMRSLVRDVKDRAEAKLIQDALQASNWNRRRAAEYLNISYRGLLYKIQQYHLSARVSKKEKSVDSCPPFMQETAMQAAPGFQES